MRRRSRGFSSGLIDWRWSLWLALLVGEGLAIGVRFDTGSVERLPRGWWTPLLALSGWVMPACAAVLAALLLLAGAKFRRVPERELVEPRRASASWPLAIAHALAFIALFALSAELFHTDSQPSHPGLLVGAWLGAVVLSLATWAAALFQPRGLARFLRSNVGWLVAALALGLAAFAVGKLTQRLWIEPLSRATFAAASSVLSTFTPEVLTDPATLTFGVRSFSVVIAPECSGYEGIGLAWVFLLAAFVLFRGELRFPRAFWLLLIGPLATWVANVVRLVALVLVGAYVSPEIGAGGFHSYAGTILFCGTALATVAFALRSPWFSRASDVRELTSNPAAPYLVPFLAMVTASLVAGAFATEDSAPLALLRPLAGLAALACYWRAYRALSWRLSWFAVPAGVIAAALWLAANRVFGWTETDAARPEGGVLALAIAALNAVLIVPLVEELAFRGFLARRIASRDFASVPPQRITWLAIALSSLAFGLLHQSLVAGFLTGVLFALCYRRNGRLADAVVAHATANALLLVAAVASGDWELWK